MRRGASPRSCRRQTQVLHSPISHMIAVQAPSGWAMRSALLNASGWVAFVDQSAKPIKSAG
jgi:hypothetical protein